MHSIRNYPSNYAFLYHIYCKYVHITSSQLITFAPKLSCFPTSKMSLAPCSGRVNRNVLRGKRENWLFMVNVKRIIYAPSQAQAESELMAILTKLISIFHSPSLWVSFSFQCCAKNEENSIYI